ncbi:MAG: GTPase ObgE [Oscillospiraceae bacterium]|jgi:GTP-binding protein|nr:GTPase ObgE [Oscillospiraceae bacterium]
MFIDTAKITLRAGRGGNGAVSFHREKYVAAGGPDGGDGGRGGHIYLVTDSGLSTLMDFRYRRRYEATDGQNGGTKGCSGRGGGDLTVRVPPGTLLRDAATGAIIHDMSADDGSGRYLAARGGRGGWGNRHFATATRQCPRFAKAGLPGEERDVVLELKLLADVGLVGFPNAGKSTLLSVVSAARPKIAGYPFTTLTPNLGVVRVGEGSAFVMADIPGLIEGAAGGAGLGHEFLRHVDRCRLLVHVVDVSGMEGRDPAEDFDAVCAELRAYSASLAERPQIVAANKCDLLQDGDGPLRAFTERLAALDIPVFPISGATRFGVDALVAAVAARLPTLPPVTVYEDEYVPPPPDLGSPDEVTIRREDHTWLVEGAWLARLLGNVNLSDYESRMYFDRMLRGAGLFSRLEAQGIAEGDIVSIYDCEFEYVK